MTNSTSTRSARRKCSHEAPGLSADGESANSASTEADEHGEEEVPATRVLMKTSESRRFHLKSSSSHFQVVFGIGANTAGVALERLN